MGGIVGELSAADVGLVVVYFVSVLVVGLLALFRPGRGGTEGYFLASNTVPWYQVGASVFASNIGSQHFVGLAGTAAATGYGVVLFEWTVCLVMFPLMFVILPVYFSSAIFTMPEYLGKRFGGQRIRIYLAMFSLVFYVLSKISVDLFAGAIFIETILKWELYPAVGVLLLITGTYTMAGGLLAVVYTETFQTLIMLCGAAILTILGFKEIGGYQNFGDAFLRATYMNTTANDDIPANSSCRSPPSDSLHLFRGVHNDLPALGFYTGQYVAALYYWGTDQVQVQRLLAAKNLVHSQGGLIMASWLKFTPMFLMVMPGMISRILYTDEVACVGAEACMLVCNNPDGCSNIAYPLLVVRLLPNGLRGLLTAVMLSALMSSLASAFNSSSTIFTLDIWTKIRKIPNKTDAKQLPHEQSRRHELELMIVGRLFILVMLGVSILWIPFVERGGNNGQLFTYITAMANILTTPILAVFLLGFLWNRITEPGAFWSLMICFGLSVIRGILDVLYPNPQCGHPDTRSPFVQAIMIHYMYFSFFNFCLALAIAMCISYCTTPIPENCLYRLTFWTRFSTKTRAPIDSIEKLDEYQTLDESTDEIPLTNAENQHTNDSHTCSSVVETQSVGTSYEENSRVLSKWTKLCYWFLGMSTIDGTEIPTESEEERELAMQNKLQLSKKEKLLIGLNLIPYIVTTIFLWVWYG